MGMQEGGDKLDQAALADRLLCSLRILARFGKFGHLVVHGIAACMKSVIQERRQANAEPKQLMQLKTHADNNCVLVLG
jgi:hypothetical protein